MPEQKIPKEDAGHLLSVEKPPTLSTIKVEMVTPEKKPVSNGTGEVNGPKGLEPTRYGDWESKGRCHDF